MKIYKVLKDVNIDDVDFVADEFVELDENLESTSELIAEGSIIEEGNDADEVNKSVPDESVDNTDQIEGNQESEQNSISLYHGANKIVSEVTTDENGLKCFTDENGTSFKLTEQEYNDQVSIK